MPDDLDGSPFTSETAQIAVAQAKKAAIDKGLERKAEVMATLAVNADLVGAYHDAYSDPQKLADLYNAASARIAQDVLTGTIKATGAQAAQLIKEFTAAARLVTGQATSVTESVSSVERTSRIQELRERLDQAQAGHDKAAEAGRVVPISS